MNRDRVNRRIDLIFRILILLSAGLWLAFPQAGPIGQTTPTAMSELSR